MSDRSKYHLEEIYRDIKVFFKSIIDVFFVSKVLLILKNLFRLTNKLTDTMLTSQTDTIKSSRDSFKRHKES